MKMHTRWSGLSVLAALMMGLVACPAASTTPADTTKPSVSLGTASTTITTAGVITLTASASDNVGVTKVEFFDGASKLGEDTTVADGFTQAVALGSSSNGAKSYTAKAFDAAGNTQTSTVLNVTVNIPVDNVKPTVTGSTALSNTSVKISFSEAITGGSNAANFSFTPTLAVSAAVVAADAKSVTLTTASQTAQSYTVSITSSVTDLAGNAIDLAGSAAGNKTFTGIAAPVTDTTRPTLTGSVATSSTSMQLVFSEAIVGGDVPGNFKLQFVDPNDFTLKNFAVTGASISSDKITVTLTTDAQTPGREYLLLITEANVTDLAGNPFDTTGSNSFRFTIFGFTP